MNYLLINKSIHLLGFPSGSVVKNPPAVQGTKETGVRSLGWEDPLEVEMATHSSILAWEIPWTEEPGGLQSVHRVAKSWMQLRLDSTARHSCAAVTVRSSEGSGVPLRHRASSQKAQAQGELSEGAGR